MKRLLAAGGMLLLAAAPAYALPQIAAGSEISIDGSDTYTLGPPPSITFIQDPAHPASVGGDTGSFVAFGTCSSRVTEAITTLTASSSGTLYTAVNNGLTTSLVINAPVSFQSTSGALPSLTASGSGTLKLTGFADTPGQYAITTQGPTGVTVTFSATSIASPVPEPSTLAILGLGVLTLVGFHRYFRDA